MKVFRKQVPSLVLVAAPCLIAAFAAACSSKSGGTGGGTGGTGGSASSSSGLILTGGLPGAGSDAGSVDYLQLAPAWPFEDSSGAKSWAQNGVPPGTDSTFDSAKAGAAKVQVLYPLDGSLHPKNLSNVTFQWLKSDQSGSSTAKFYRVVIVGPDKAVYHLYFDCENAISCQAGFTGSSSEWYDLGKTYAGKTVTITVQELSGTTVNSSAPVHLTFSPENVLGTIYYWAASGYRIKRATFGGAAAADFIVPNSDTNHFACAACHSVSRDGTTIAFTVTSDQGESVGAIQIAPTETPEKPYVQPDGGLTSPSPFATLPKDVTDLMHGGAVTTGPTSNFGHSVALSSDGKFAAVNGVPEPPAAYWPPYFEIRKQDGTAVKRYTLGDSLFGGPTLPIMAEWSPDSTQIAVHMTDNSTSCSWTYTSCNGGLATLPVATDGTLSGGPQYLVQGDAAHYYHSPTWSPDGKWIVFVSSPKTCSSLNTCGGSCKSDCNNSNTLYIIKSSGGPYTCPSANCVELTKGVTYNDATAATSGKHATTPKAAPFVQSNGNIFFVTYASQIPYGTYSQHNQLWMFGINTSLLPSDPSYAPFWVPYQEPTEDNFSPYWAGSAPCTSAGGGCSGCRSNEICYVLQETNTCTCVATGVK